MEQNDRKAQIEEMRRHAQNERLRRAFETLEASIAEFPAIGTTLKQEALEDGYRAALWELRQAMDDPTFRL